MKLCKYYSLDECHDESIIIDRLDELQNDSKIEYTHIQDDDIIKLKNIGLSVKEKKDLLSFFKENDIIDDPDYEEYYEEDELEDDEEDDEDEEY